MGSSGLVEPKTRECGRTSWRTSAFLTAG